MHAKSLQSPPTLCDTTDCSQPGSSVHRILHARILERVAMPSCRGSSQPRDWTCISCDPCISGRFLTTEPLGKPSGLVICGLYYAVVFSSIPSLLRIFMIQKVKVKVSHTVVSDSLWSHGLYPDRILYPRNSASKITVMGCHFLL